ncbi:hypothetical protein GOBAR_DD34228 [Gossypium barbadense]|nr:hypothetical protein GOBAR_DD34228 [Gossypium barbadense]
MDDYGLFATECNSGYESGWTNYLDHSILSANPSSNDFKDSNDRVAALDKNGAKQQVPPSCLDDTATSSPLINFSKTYDEVSMESVFDYPLQGFSATHFMGGPAFRDHYGFYQYSPYGNQLQTNQLNLKGDVVPFILHFYLDLPLYQPLQ